MLRLNIVRKDQSARGVRRRCTERRRQQEGCVTVQERQGCARMVKVEVKLREGRRWQWQWRKDTTPATFGPRRRKLTEPRRRADPYDERDRATRKKVARCLIRQLLRCENKIRAKRMKLGGENTGQCGPRGERKARLKIRPCGLVDRWVDTGCGVVIMTERSPGGHKGYRQS